MHDEYVRRVANAEHEIIWTHPGMSTYYRNRGPGLSVTPCRLVDYWAMTHETDLADYVITPAD